MLIHIAVGSDVRQKGVSTMPDGGVSLFEWAKLLVSLATPIAVVVIGYLLNARLRSIEQRRWLSQKVIEKRLTLFESMAPKLNDLLCFFTYVGHWKELDPPRIIALKRELDKEMHVHRALFPSQLGANYEAFMESCFKMWGAVGADARFRTGFESRKQAAGDRWKPEWERVFEFRDQDDAVREARAEQRGTYKELMTAFAVALGVTDGPAESE